MIDESIFKAYDIRGVYPEQVNEEAAWKIGHASAQFLRSLLHGYERGEVNMQSVVVGRDMRTHSESLATALKEGMMGSGANVIDIGVIDTPQIYFAINHLGTCGGVQVTASHNPAHYNGFKISGLGARPIGGQTGLQEIKHIATTLRHTKAAGSGTVKVKDLTDPYRQHVLSFLAANLRRLKIVVDASNGMAGKWVPLLFGGLGIEMTVLNEECTGVFKHEPNPLVESNLAELKAAVLAQGADVGVCFDGDADRLVIVDEKGETVGCDLMTGLFAGYFLAKSPGATVIYDLRSSRAVKEEIVRHGGQPRRERVGHAFMKKTLKDTKGVFGGELSGHFYYRDNFYADSGMITLVHLLNVLSASSKPLSEMIEPLKRYACSGEMNFEVENKEKMMAQLEEKYAAGKIDHLDGVTVEFEDWWFNCRASNTEPLLRLNVEANTEDLLKERIGELESVLGKPVAH
ncbi:MAG: phosphomannomutase/phosphoglucomutase [Sedimentisphaerales bacterium]|nr:phosphomannomutase/phosphoglucomutase [Sedimentisphaerales bacterium]